VQVPCIASELTMKVTERAQTLSNPFTSQGLQLATALQSTSTGYANNADKQLHIGVNGGHAG